MSDDDSKTGKKGQEESEHASPLGWAKKIMTVGVGAYFLTEDALKTLVSEVKLPKEIVSGILDGAKGVRKEFMQNFVAEMMSRVSEKVDPAQMIAEFLKKNEVTFEIKIKVKDKE